jgi:tetratricopeptide (TPR) repeat protein
MAEQAHNSVGGRARIDTLVQAGSIGELHQHHHVHEAPVADGVAPPFQLPPEIRHFEDRETEQSRALQVIEDRPDTHSGPTVLLFSGFAGVGKTTLGFQVARRVRDSFPDGVLYLDLDDHRARDGGADLTDALGELLRDLGVMPSWLEQSYAARQKQYWSRTQGRRLVVILDNVRYGVEAEPLLPASAGSVAVVISHGRLHDIEGSATLELPLAPLEETYAVRLLHRIIVDDPRLTEEPQAVAELARLCGGLPAALHVAAQWVRKHRRRRLPRLLEELTAELYGKGVAVVEAVWNAAYGDLGADAARLYRLLAVAPGPSITPDAAAALLGTGRDAADDALDELETASLLLRGEGDRLRMHDLLRAHARRCADRGGDGAEIPEARRRIVRWHLRQAQRADELAAGKRMTLGEAVGPLPYGADVPFADKHGALHWLEAERLALRDCVHIAYAHGLDAEAWALCEPLWTHFLDHPHHIDTIEAFRIGLDAAVRAGHIPAMVRMRCQLARPLWEQERYDEATAEAEQALSAAQALGESDDHRKLTASAIEFRGKVLSEQGDWAGAAPYFERSRQIHVEIGNAYGVLLQTYLLGRSAAGTGAFDEAATLLAQAHEMARDQQRERLTSRTGFELGRVLQRLGRTGEARELYESALAGAGQRGSTYDETRVHEALAALAEQTGDATTAERHREAARAIRDRSA